MAELSRFYGIVIAIFFRGERGRHNLPHIHVRYAEFVASVALDGTIIEGRLPPTARRLVLRWAHEHQEELEFAWESARRGRTPPKIEPLR
jgi:Domain of unknown function (DUF4160)